MKRMASVQWLLCLTVLLLDKNVLAKISGSQSSVEAHKVKNTFLSVTVGDDITLNCMYKNDLRAKLYWYKQSLDDTQNMVSSYFDKKEFYNEFNNNPRFALDNNNTKNHLNIKSVQLSDSAVYHCICGVAHQIQFLKTITMIVKDLNTGLWINQTISENVEPGKSVSLKCTVHTGSCDGGHRVSWFKKTEDSHAGVLYSHGDQCERNTDSKTNACVFNLPIHNVRSEQTGTYYCAVASCGQVLFGNGTRLRMKDPVESIVYILSGALVFTSVLVVILAFSLCSMKKKQKWQSTAQHSGDIMTMQNAENDQDNLHYAALSINNSSRRQRNTAPTDCVYSSVQHN